MSKEINNGIAQSICDNLTKVRDIILQNNCNSNSPNGLPTDTESLVEELYSEFFQKFFIHYDDNIFCNRRSCGTVYPSSIPPTDEDLWIFGYGSLVWKADFSFIDKKQGYIEGYQRRFFQHSIDHRGTPDRPGRVVTLVPSNNQQDRVYGVAYRIAKQEKNEVLAHLDFREKNGYQRKTLKFIEFGTGYTNDIIIYIATNDNDSFAGGNEDDLQPIADQIYTTAGPSGPNREYLYYLANAMRDLFPGVVDDHLFKLEEIVKERERKDEMLIGMIKSKIRTILMHDNIDVIVEKFHELFLSCSTINN
ncbi:putative glutathione-specific gamma-glutamylcyclotransferase 2 [Eupeodes corollae]|uniref:putative glutathione-specific gamma-glutamylcyclotransferase 2 n=1 Tax=Eupeodes corollae TaxID=290404 RepID=UPI002491244C|nr:putative glutathione-specific gamma-glutamylcyclotransferase 2 [Eupeodes corollae]